MKNRILIVEDDKEISQLLTSFLEENEYEVDSAFDGSVASHKLADETYDLVLMDMMLPYKDGATLIQELRTHADTPVLVLSAKSMLETRLEVLRLGADDYVIKPFDLNEVLVRMEVILRRSQKPEEEQTQKVLQAGALVYNLENEIVQYEGNDISLTVKERKMLELFLRNPSKTFSKANLYEAVWEEEYCYDDNTINVHVSNLRNKLKRATGQDFIDTVWGIGYRLKQVEE